MEAAHAARPPRYRSASDAELLRDFTRGGRILNEQQQEKIAALRAARDDAAAPADPTP